MRYWHMQHTHFGRGLCAVSLLLLAVTLVAGCGTTAEAMRRANDTFVGKHLDDFVLAHGIPQANYQLSNGEFLYFWRSDVVSQAVPSTTSVQGMVGPSGFYSGTAITSGGHTIESFCEVMIRTKEDGTILSIEARRDTMGLWNASRAAEIFK